MSETIGPGRWLGTQGGNMSKRETSENAPLEMRLADRWAREIFDAAEKRALELMRSRPMMAPLTVGDCISGEILRTVIKRAQDDAYEVGRLSGIEAAAKVVESIADEGFGRQLGHRVRSLIGGAK